MPIHDSDSSVLLEEQEITATTTVNGDGIYLNMPGWSAQVDWTDSGELAGTVKLQGRIGQDMNWLDLTGTEQDVTGSDGYLWNLRDQHYTQARLVVSVTAGTGIFKAKYSSKAIS